jgi:hypothetical protein
MRKASIKILEHVPFAPVMQIGSIVETIEGFWNVRVQIPDAWGLAVFDVFNSWCCSGSRGIASTSSVGSADLCVFSNELFGTLASSMVSCDTLHSASNYW